MSSSPQNCIATHECNGIDIIIALILNDINPLGKKRMDLVLELKVSVNRFLMVLILMLFSVLSICLNVMRYIFHLNFGAVCSFIFL